jgi:hypothetical protein
VPIINAAIDAASHLLLIGAGPAQRLSLLSAVLDKLDDRQEAAVVYDPTGNLAREFYLQAHHDIQIAPIDLSSCPWPQRKGIYAGILADEEPLGVKVLRPNPAITATWNLARWAERPDGWVFLTHETFPTLSQLKGVGITLSAIAQRIALSPARCPGIVWLIFDEPPYLPSPRYPFAYLAPSFRRDAGQRLKTVLTLSGAGSLDQRYGSGVAEALAFQPHTRILVSPDRLTVPGTPPIVRPGQVRFAGKRGLLDF